MVSGYFGESQIHFCPHCMNVVEGCRYADRILMHMRNQQPLPDRCNPKEHKRWTADGICEDLDIPIAATYRALNWLVDAALLTRHPRKMHPDGRHSAWVYMINPAGRQWADSLANRNKEMQRICQAASK